MKLLLDQGLPRSAAPRLTEAGIDTIHVGDLGLASASDADILQAGLSSGRTIVTLDADFHSILAAKRAVSPSVIRIRIEGLRSVALTAILRSVVTECKTEIERGAALTVQAGRIRIRHLPLIDGTL